MSVLCVKRMFFHNWKSRCLRFRIWRASIIKVTFRFAAETRLSFVSRAAFTQQQEVFFFCTWPNISSLLCYPVFLRIKEQRILWKVFDNNLRKPKSIVICQQFFPPPVRSDRYAKIFPLRKLRITQAYYTLHSREVHLFAKNERGMKYSQNFSLPYVKRV